MDGERPVAVVEVGLRARARTHHNKLKVSALDARFSFEIREARQRLNLLLLLYSTTVDAHARHRLTRNLAVLWLLLLLLRRGRRK